MFSEGIQALWNTQCTGSETLNTGEGARPEKPTLKAGFHNGKSPTIPFKFDF